MSRLTSRAIGAAVLALTVTVGTASLSPAAAQVDRSVVEGVVGFLLANQQPDGGFELAGFPGFETPDAVIALADAGVDIGRVVSSDDETPLDYLDHLADGTIGGAPTSGRLGKIALAAASSHQDLRAFDPRGDGAVDLVAAISSALEADPTAGGQINDVAYAVMGLAAAGASVPSSSIDHLVRSQQTNGSWSFAGDPDGTVEDPDTTAAAVMALVAGGFDVSHPSVRSALAMLARSQAPNGTWNGDNPNSTALAVLAIVAAGYDPGYPGWRDSVAPELAAEVYTSPTDALAALQSGDGHITSPFDGFGVNTSATSQSLQAFNAEATPGRVTVPPVQAYPPVVDGYAIGAADGGLFAFGSQAFTGSWAGLALNTPVVDVEIGCDGRGAFAFASDGGIFTAGTATFFGSLGAIPLNEPIVDAELTPSCRGALLAGADGGIFTVGDATFPGSLVGEALPAPIVDIESKRNGAGIVAADELGNVYPLGGDADVEGLDGLALAAPISDFELSPDGSGATFLGRDGGVFTTGSAEFTGSLGGLALAGPAVDLETTRHGYRILTTDGGVFAFGDASFEGSLGGVPLAGPAVALS